MSFLTTVKQLIQYHSRGLTLVFRFARRNIYLIRRYCLHTSTLVYTVWACNLLCAQASYINYSVFSILDDPVWKEKKLSYSWIQLRAVVQLLNMEDKARKSIHIVK